MLTSERDLAKFPFTVETSNYVKSRGIDVGQLASREYSGVVDRAIERVKEAWDEGVVRTKKPIDDIIEILSYPVSIMIVAAIGDSFLKRRYARAEAERVSRVLQSEIFSKAAEYVLNIGRNTFLWDIRREDHDFALYFVDYLRSAADLQTDEWKLVNRVLVGGYVRLTLNDAIKLIREEVRKKIERRIEEHLKFELPRAIQEKIEPLRKLVIIGHERIDVKARVEGFLIQAFPPCIASLYSSIASGKHVSHLGRFTLTSFLLNVGMSPSDVIALFSQLVDFDQRKTTYQVEHIAGAKGSRTKYLAPNCSTLRTHGLCVGAGDLCKSIRNPLSYYRKKMLTLREGVRK